MPLVPTLVRVLVILLAVAGAAGHLAYLDALWWHSLRLTSTVIPPPRPVTIVLLAAHAVVSVVCSVFAVVMVLSEHHRQQAARALGLAFGAWSYLMAYSGVTLLYRPASPGTPRDLFEAHFLVVEVIGLAAIVRYTAVFPRPLHKEELAPSGALPALLRPVYAAAVGLRRSWAPALSAVAVLALVWSVTLARGGGLGDAGLSRLMDVIRFCAAGVAVLNLWRAWACATEGDRDGLAWLLVALAVLAGALAILIGGNVLVAVTGFPEPEVAWRPILLDFGLVGFMAASALSVLHRGRHDPARILRGVTVTSALVTLGLFLAAGLEALFTAELVANVSVRHGFGTALAFALVLSTYRQLAGWITRMLPA